MAHWTTATLLDRLLETLSSEVNHEKAEILVDPDATIGGLTAADVVVMLKDRVLMESMERRTR